MDLGQKLSNSSQTPPSSVFYIQSIHIYQPPKALTLTEQKGKPRVTATDGVLKISLQDCMLKKKKAYNPETVCGIKNLKYLISSHLQKKFFDPWTRKLCIQVHIHIHTHTYSYKRQNEYRRNGVEVKRNFKFKSNVFIFH